MILRKSKVSHVISFFFPRNRTRMRQDIRYKNRFAVNVLGNLFFAAEKGRFPSNGAFTCVWQCSIGHSVVGAFIEIIPQFSALHSHDRLEERVPRWHIRHTQYKPHVWKGAYRSNGGNRGRNFRLTGCSRFLERERRLTCTLHGKRTRSVIYIYVRTSIAIGCESDLIAPRRSRRGMSGNPRRIRETTPEDRSRSHPWRRHRRPRGRLQRNCGSKFRGRRKWMICFEHVSEALRHGDVIMEAVERQREKERLHFMTLLIYIGIWLMHYFLRNQLTSIFNKDTTWRQEKMILVTLNT